jgi:hypothetical protein
VLAGKHQNVAFTRAAVKEMEFGGRQHDMRQNKKAMDEQLQKYNNAANLK